MRILITTARAPAALEMVRHLTKAGHEVLLADSRTFPLSRYSRFAGKYFRVCPPGKDADRYCEDLRRIVINESVDLVLPVFEEILHLAARIDRFEGLTKIFCDDFEKLNTLHNKYTFAQTAEEIGMRVPETHLLVDEVLLAQFADCSTEYVFKPVYSRFGDQVLIGPDAETLAKVKPSPDHPWVAQKLIAGELFCSFGIAQQGELRGHSTYQPTCFAGGAGILFHSSIEHEILWQVRKLVHEMQFTGFISFDFIRDQRGKFHVIECNPRTTSGIHFFNSTTFSPENERESGLCHALLHADGTLIQASPDQKKMLGFAMALYGWSKKNRLPGTSSFARALRSAGDVIFSWKDPLPLLVSPLMLTETWMSAISNGVLLTRSGTYDHEWNEQNSTNMLIGA